MADLNAIEVSSTVDARGSACPGPLLEAKKGIGKVKVGEVLEIYSNDSGTRTDIPAWSNKVGHEYLGVLEAEINRWSNDHSGQRHKRGKDPNPGNRNLRLPRCQFGGASPFELSGQHLYHAGESAGSVSGAVLP